MLRVYQGKHVLSPVPGIHSVKITLHIKCTLRDIHANKRVAHTAEMGALEAAITPTLSDRSSIYGQALEILEI